MRMSLPRCVRCATTCIARPYVAATVSSIVAVPQASFYNRVVGDTDIPLQMSALSVLIIFGATMLVGVVAALYPSWRVAARRPTLVLGRS